MKNRISFIFILVLLFSFYSKVFASELCSPSGYTILTINGIFTDEGKAKNNKDRLKDHLQPNYNNQPLKVDFLYNQTHFAGGMDLLDAASQKLFENENVNELDYDFIEMLNDASKKVDTQKVLIVGHSQGNFYANGLYKKIASKPGGIPSESLSVYGVASPSSYVAGGGKYLTSSTDSTINKVRILGILKVLPSNINIPLQNIGGNGHSFSEVYLKYAGNRIVSEIKSSLDKLQNNDEQLPQDPCISPPELTAFHKIQGVAFASADFVINNSYKGAVYVADGAYGIGATIGTFIRKTTLAVNNVFSKSFANIVESLGSPAVFTTLPVDFSENASTNISEDTKKAEEDTKNISVDVNEEKITEETNPPVENNEINKNIETTPTPANLPAVPAPAHGNGASNINVEENNDNNNNDDEEDDNNNGGDDNGGGGGNPSASDTTPPVITMTGASSIDVIKDTVYTDAGATALDDVDGDLTSVIVKSGTFINTATVGAYTIIYTTTDISNNVSTQTRTINVVAPPPPPLETFTIDTDTTLTAGEYNYDNLVITNNAKLLLESNPDSLNSFKGVKITAVNITIDSGSSISANAKGYVDGPGIPPENTAGASYGGVGDRNIATSIYGSAKEPIELGSGGTNYFHGGGAIRLVVSDTITNNGTISTNGDSTSSGGSIYLTTKNLSGSGTFSANGGGLYPGSVLYGSGGGGRIALYYESSSFTGVAEAKGGCGSYNGYSAVCAENGTVGFFDTVNNNLLVKTSWLFQKNDSPFNLKKITLTDGAKVKTEKETNIVADELLVDKISEFTLADSLIMNIPIISLNDNSTLILSGGETITANTLTLTENSTITVVTEKILSLTIPNININFGSSISASVKGYLDGPGASTTSQVGASYGGVGAGNILTSVYGSETEPVDFGSGGVNNYRGGGAIKLVVDNTFINNGTVSASGAATSSGGSVYVITKNLSGSGTFSANGGATDCGSICVGPGGGGRVAIHYESSSFTGQALADGANGSAGRSTAGTVKMIDTSIPAPDTTPPSITSYTFNTVADNITTNPLTDSVTLALTANENVDWTSIKIENQDNASIYKIFQSGAGCVDGTSTCTKVWNGLLSSGGLLQNGTFRIKVHMKDTALNDFYDYITPYVINVNIPI